MGYKEKPEKRLHVKLFGFHCSLGFKAKSFKKKSALLLTASSSLSSYENKNLSCHP